MKDLSVRIRFGRLVFVTGGSGKRRWRGASCTTIWRDSSRPRAVYLPYAGSLFIPVITPWMERNHGMVRISTKEAVEKPFSEFPDPVPG